VEWVEAEVWVAEAIMAEAGAAIKVAEQWLILVKHQKQSTFGANFICRSNS
jgi:hypothetical protein